MPEDILVMLIISLLIFWFIYRVIRSINILPMSLPDPLPTVSHCTSITIDPPSGWMYGFPKEISILEYESEEFNMGDWLVQNGYPKDNVPFALEHIRIWVN